MLQGVLDSARSLTDARYALITTLSESGQVEDCQVSGLRADESQRLWEMPEGLSSLDYLSALVSFNREAARILESLRTPGQPVEQLREVLTIRGADGQEIPLEELSMVQVLTSAETLRSEQVVLEIPGGRSVTVMIDATSSRSEGASWSRCS